MDVPRVAHVSRWRLQGRRRWIDARPLVLLSAAGITLLLGYLGFRHSPATEDGGALDALYRSFKLFGFSGGDIDPPIAWELQVARVLGPLLVGYAAIRGLVVLFREQFLLLRLRLRARNHVVVVGLGDSGFRLLSSLHDAGLSTVGIERRTQNPSIADCRLRGIPVVVGDGRDPGVLESVRCDRAAHVVALAGRDDVSLGILAATARLSQRPGWVPTWFHAEIEDEALWRRLRISALANRYEGRLRVEFFSVQDSIARAVAEQALLASEISSTAVVGLDASIELVDDLTGHVLRVVSGQRDRPIEVVLLGAARAERPAVERGIGAQVGVISADPVEGELSESEAKRLEGAVIIVAGHEDSAVLARSAAWVGACPTAKVVADVGTRGFVDSLEAGGIRPDGVRWLNVSDRVLGPSLLTDTALEAIARAKHDDYVRLAVERGESPESNPSIRGWDELPGPLRDSNRRFADDVGEKLSQLGASLTPAQFVPRDATDLELPADVMEELARREHDRWVADLLKDGWRFGDGPKDPERKLHPLLVPWDDLPDSEREKDRDGVRSLPSLLAAAGYRMMRIEESGPRVRSNQMR